MGISRRMVSSGLLDYRLQFSCDTMPRMKSASSLLWALLAVLGAVALAQVAGLVNPNEKVNGLWLVVAAACIYVLAYRFYGRWLATARNRAEQSAHYAGRAFERRGEFSSHQ